MRFAVLNFVLSVIYFISFSQKFNYAYTAKIADYKTIYLNTTYYSQYVINHNLEIHSKLLFLIPCPNFGIKYNFYNIERNYRRRFFKKFDIYFTAYNYIYFPKLLLRYVEFYNYLDFGQFTIDRGFFVDKFELDISLEQNKRKGCNNQKNLYTIRLGTIQSLYRKDKDFVNYYNIKTYKNTVFLSRSGLYYLGIGYDTWLIGGIYIKLLNTIYMDRYKQYTWINESRILGYGYLDKKELLRLTFGFEWSFSNNIYLKPKFRIIGGLSIAINFNKGKNTDKLFERKVFKPSKYREI